MDDTIITIYCLCEECYMDEAGRTLSWSYMALPEFREDGWLPEGHYSASWEEVIDRFGGSPGSRRGRVLRVLLSWRDEAREKGISGLLLLNGSFISSREDIGDFDALLVYDDHVIELRKNDIEVEGLRGLTSTCSIGTKTR